MHFLRDEHFEITNYLCQARDASIHFIFVFLFYRNQRCSTFTLHIGKIEC